MVEVVDEVVVAEVVAAEALDDSVDKVLVADIVTSIEEISCLIFGKRIHRLKERANQLCFPKSAWSSQ